MTKWEYAVKAASNQSTFMEMLNEMGNDGWEVIKMDMSARIIDGGLAYFKRAKEDAQKSTLLTD